MEKVRSFISISIPEFDTIDDIKDRLGRIKDVKVSNDTHMTLRFLGDVDPHTLYELADRMDVLSSYPSFNITLEGLGAFPNAGSPRVIWIGIKAPDTLNSIVETISNILDTINVDYDRKPFKGHVTIARVKNNNPDITSEINGLKDVKIGDLRCSEIHLIRSDLSPKGAVHSVIKTIHLS